MATSSYHNNNISTSYNISHIHSHRHRPSSPFNSTNSVDGHLPGHSSSPSATASFAPPPLSYPNPSPTNPNPNPNPNPTSHSNSSFGRGRAPASPTAAARSMTPTTFKFKFNGSSSSPSSSSSPPHPAPLPPPSLPLASSLSSPNAFSTNGFSSFQASSGNGGSGTPKENVIVTVRFRPLSLREIQRGDEVAWYADGDNTVRSEYNPSSAYAFDRVFGPATTTRAVYDAAAKQVVRGAMEGINGTVFAYGVTSSGKTHTMHGDQRSPGIIPLAVKDVFNIIQDTPGREYLLRVSYLEIYNEIINDLLDPAGQNLRIREDSQGTYVEGVKEEVVLSPAHALSLIAAGEEHRHVGSNNFNLLSSRSHTIFTLTIESSARTGDSYDDDISLSQLNLIDLAGSESSKTETTGLRRKEGSYINKSLLTLGTVIGKLSEGKASHVPFRDSKLTRLLQSSLSGYGRVSLICTLTPASSNIEETHNTLKFAHRAKRVAIYAAPNRIMDEKSLIKKYQKEIYCLKQELDQMKRGMFDKSFHNNSNTQEDLLYLRQQLEAGQVKLQSRLEEEEQAKSALLGRIQRLTKLILVSTKTTSLLQEPERPLHRRCHSFGAEDLKYLREKRHELGLDFDDDDDGGGSVGHNQEPSLEAKLDGDEVAKEDKKKKQRGMLGWFKLLRNGNLNPSSTSVNADVSPNGSPSQNVPILDRRKSFSRKNFENASVFDSFPQSTQAGELFSATIHGRRPAPTGETVADQMDLLREQAKMLAGEVGFCTSSLKRMAEQAAVNPDDVQFQAQMEKMKNEIRDKRHQIEVLERRILAASQAALNNASPVEMSQTISKLMGQLNEKQFELELRTADNRILQEQLQTKVSEIKQLQNMITTMQQQPTLLEDDSTNLNHSYYQRHPNLRPLNSSDVDTDVPQSNKLKPVSDLRLQNQVLEQAGIIERLEQEKDTLIEENGGLQIQVQKLAEEASYAKELASAAAVELKNLAEEVKKLSLQNSQLANDLITVQEASFSRLSRTSSANGSGFAKKSHVKLTQERGWTHRNLDDDVADIDSWELDPEDVKMELKARKEREEILEAALSDKERVEAELRKKLEDAKQREADLENDLAGMWVTVAQLKMEKRTLEDSQADRKENRCTGVDVLRPADELQCALEEEKQRNSELRKIVSRLKGEELEGLSLSTLEELQSLHMDALTKLCQAKAKGREAGFAASLEKQPEERNGHTCKVCFEAPTAAVLLPCRHFCWNDYRSVQPHFPWHVVFYIVFPRLKPYTTSICRTLWSDHEAMHTIMYDQSICYIPSFPFPETRGVISDSIKVCKPCAVACTECPLCRSGIADRIITFTS